MIKTGVFIGNKWHKSASGERFAVYNPEDNSVVTEIESGNAADVDSAVQAALKAFEDGPWPRMSGEERSKIMLRVARLIEENQDELARLETMDSGKPIVESRNIDIPFSWKAMDYYAALGRDIRGDLITVSGAEVLDYTLYEPVGVAAIIIPWNFPLHLATRGAAPALAAGNTIVMKPSTLAPVTPLIFGELCKEAGMPEGVINIVPGTGKNVGVPLINHPAVNLVSFTGSVEVGQEVMRVAAADMKRVVLELGGKGPSIVFPDADLEMAVKGTVFGFCLNQGQVCCAGTKLILHDSIYDEFLEKLVAQTEKLRIGPGLDDKTQIGPLISPQHRETVAGYVQKGREEGGRVLTGGEMPGNPALAKGNYYPPTIIDGVTGGMCVYREEIFGPVLAVTRFTDEEEAVAMANDTEYGLSSAVWSTDSRRLHRLARQLRAGTVWLNTMNKAFVEAPYGGYKKSGMGREYGLYGLRQYMEVKNVIEDLSSEGLDWYEANF